MIINGRDWVTSFVFIADEWCYSETQICCLQDTQTYRDKRKQWLKSSFIKVKWGRWEGKKELKNHMTVERDTDISTAAESKTLELEKHHEKMFLLFLPESDTTCLFGISSWFIPGLSTHYRNQRQHLSNGTVFWRGVRSSAVMCASSRHLYAVWCISLSIGSQHESTWLVFPNVRQTQFFSQTCVIIN